MNVGQALDLLRRFIYGHLPLKSTKGNGAHDDSNFVNPEKKKTFILFGFLLKLANFQLLIYEQSIKNHFLYKCIFFIPLT